MIITRLRRRHLLLVSGLVALAFISSACARSGTGSTGDSREGEPTQVRELTSIDTLQDAFNDHEGSTRLILIISPT